MTMNFTNFSIRQIAFSLSRIYIFYWLFSMVFVDGRMKCTTYHCAGGNYGFLSEDLAKRSSVESDVMRRELQRNSRITRLLTRTHLPNAEVSNLLGNEQADVPQQLEGGRHVETHLRSRSASFRRTPTSIPSRSHPWDDVIDSDPLVTSRRKAESWNTAAAAAAIGGDGSVSERQRQLKRWLSKWLDERYSETLHS